MVTELYLREDRHFGHFAHIRREEQMDLYDNFAMNDLLDSKTENTLAHYATLFNLQHFGVADTDASSDASSDTISDTSSDSAETMSLDSLDEATDLSFLGHAY